MNRHCLSVLFCFYFNHFPETFLLVMVLVIECPQLQTKMYQTCLRTFKIDQLRSSMFQKSFDFTFVIRAIKL